MEFDQIIFKKILQFTKALKKNNAPKNEEHTIYLSDIKNKLTIIARLLSGVAIEIFPAEKYSSLKNNIYFLPEKYNRFDSKEKNYFFYIFRIFYLYAQQKLDIYISNIEAQNIEIALQKSVENSPKILAELNSEFPILMHQFNEIYNTEFISEIDKNEFQYEWFGKLSIDENKNNNNEHVDKKVNQWEQLNELNKKSVELNSKAKENIEILEVDKEKQEQYTLTHNFEKVETIDDFNGSWRDFDDDQDLEENSEALEELDMNQMVRVDSPSHSVYHAEFFNSKGIKESKAKISEVATKFVDEWDYQQKKYKKNFCQIYESQLSETSIAYTQKTFEEQNIVLRQLEKKLNNFFNEYQIIKKQPEGEEIDLEAITERFTDIQAGITPKDNIFLSKRKNIKDIAILILTDISLSTDGYVNDHRIIDTEKQSLLLFGEILHKYNTQFQIDVFSSKTRNHCDYHTIKKFNDDWDKQKHHIGAIQPKGYTRIGAAIRNAHEQLKNINTKKKWLLLLTDGKPNDYDRYEGKYGIEDIKHAIKEVRNNDIHVSALAIDSNAKFYLPQMLGKGAFQIIHKPSFLPEALTNMYLKLIE